MEDIKEGAIVALKGDSSIKFTVQYVFDNGNARCWYIHPESKDIVWKDLPLVCLEAYN